MPQVELERRFASVRAATSSLAEPLSAEDCALQSAPFCSPVKWHLAHTTWFFETFVLAEFARGWKPVDPNYRVLFNSYYHAVGERHPRPERGLLSRPSLDLVREYRRRVDVATAELLASEAGREGVRAAELRARVELGLAHEEQHQELLLTDVKHLFGRSPLRPAYRPLRDEPIAARHASREDGERDLKLGWTAFPEGVHEFGSEPGSGFAFDHEGPRHRRFVGAFELANRLVTNRDFLAFIDDGGYRRSDLWQSEGFDFVQAERVEAPLHWRKSDGRWTRFTLAGERDLELDLDAPLCHVSWYEADAFARWRGARLPTEFEWELAAACSTELADDDGSNGGFLESRCFDPQPATARSAPAAPNASRRPDDSALTQLFGAVWQWTASAYEPYPGYRAPSGALGEYNGKFMVNQLVLRGGSCVTPRGHVRASYRNFFHAHERWQFSGLRLARDAR